MNTPITFSILAPALTKQASIGELIAGAGRRLDSLGAYDVGGALSSFGSWAATPSRFNPDLRHLAGEGAFYGGSALSRFGDWAKREGKQTQEFGGWLVRTADRGPSSSNPYIGSWRNMTSYRGRLNDLGGAALGNLGRRASVSGRDLSRWGERESPRLDQLRKERLRALRLQRQQEAAARAAEAAPAMEVQASAESAGMDKVGNLLLPYLLGLGTIPALGLAKRKWDEHQLRKQFEAEQAFMSQGGYYGA